MLITGTQADRSVIIFQGNCMVTEEKLNYITFRLNSKWTIVLSLSLLVLSNAILPIIAHFGVWYVVMARVLVSFYPPFILIILKWYPSFPYNNNNFIDKFLILDRFLGCSSSASDNIDAYSLVPSKRANFRYWPCHGWSSDRDTAYNSIWWIFLL